MNQTPESMAAIAEQGGVVPDISDMDDAARYNIQAAETIRIERQADIDKKFAEDERAKLKETLKMAGTIVGAGVAVAAIGEVAEVASSLHIIPPFIEDLAGRLIHRRGVDPLAAPTETIRQAPKPVIGA